MTAPWCIRAWLSGLAERMEILVTLAGCAQG
jgi:hypothetical protein